jgi:hypothetical protein
MYFLMLMVLISTSLSAMDKQLVPSLINELLDTHFVSCVTLQEKSRLRCTCKGNMDLIITENFLYKDNSYALDHLFNKFPYDLRSKILAHYGLTKNRGMFTFLWNKEKELRDDDVMYFDADAPYLLEYCMALYAEKYSTREKIQGIRIQQLHTAICWPVSSPDNRFSMFLKKILPGSGFNIWDIKIASSKKLLSRVAEKRKTRDYRKKVVEAICKSQDANLLLAIMGGRIEPRAFKYIFKYSEKLFIEALEEKDAFIKDAPDKYNKTFQYYQRSYDLQQA